MKCLLHPSIPTPVKTLRRFPRQLIPALFLILLFGVIMPYFAALAHPLGGVIQNTHVFRPGELIFIDYQTHMGPTSIILLKPDHDRDGLLSGQEKKALLKELKKTLRPNIKVTLDGHPAELEIAGEELSTVNAEGYYAEGVNLRLLYRIDLKNIQPGQHIFRISDENFLSGELDSLSYAITVLMDIEKAGLLDGGRMMEMVFITGSETNLGQAGDPSAMALQESKVAGKGKALGDLLRKQDFGPGLIIAGLFLALFLGGSHALTPGHGKAMVAAYLIGSRGRIKDAVMLGGIVTFTHVISVVLLGIITLFLSKYIMPQRLFPWIGACSGALIFLLGYYMLAKRAITAPTHNHHHHLKPEGRPAIKEIISLGVAGGMAPCPTALVVLLISISVNRIPAGLLLIVFFSLGLAVVLMLIGILTVTASKFLEKFSETKTWIQRLPVFSSGVIMIVGILIAFNALTAGGVLAIK